MAWLTNTTGINKELPMSTVRDMIRKKATTIFSVTPDATVLDALRIMETQNIGALMVIRGGKVEGILSERDIVRKVELAGKTARDTLVSEIMTTKVVYIEAGQQLEECMALMIDKNIRHLPVYDGNELVGLISVRDVMKEMVDVQKFMISQLEHYITGGGR
jgi:CBS domain-containing protein